jgi:hypothetical protein
MEMKLLLGAALVLAYVVLAVVVARFCAVNRGWEEAVDEMPDEVPFPGGRTDGPTRRPVALKA